MDWSLSKVLDLYLFVDLFSVHDQPDRHKVSIGRLESFFSWTRRDQYRPWDRQSSKRLQRTQCDYTFVISSLPTFPTISVPLPNETRPWWTSGFRCVLSSVKKGTDTFPRVFNRLSPLGVRSFSWTLFYTLKFSLLFPTG